MWKEDECEEASVAVAQRIREHQNPNLGKQVGPESSGPVSQGSSNVLWTDTVIKYNENGLLKN